MRLFPIATTGETPQVCCRILFSAVLSVLVMVACSGLARAAPSSEGGQSAREMQTGTQELTEPDAAFLGIDRSDCLVEEAVCRSECKAGLSQEVCAADP